MFSRKLSLLTIFLGISGINAFSANPDSRRAFIKQVGTVTAAGVGFASLSTTGSPSLIDPANAAPEILKTAAGIKYAITKPVTKGAYPQPKDIVAIEYTGYLSNGQVSYPLSKGQGKE